MTTGTQTDIDQPSVFPKHTPSNAELAERILERVDTAAEEYRGEVNDQERRWLDESEAK